MSKRWTQEDIERLGLKTDLQGKGKTAFAIPPSVKQDDAEKGKTALENYQALGRMKAGKMNETEKAYAERLEWLKHAGEVLWWRFGVINLKIAEDCFYRTDFAVLLSSGNIEIHETKGHWTDDALVKIKVAAELFPFRFVAMQYRKGEWVQREF